MQVTAADVRKYRHLPQPGLIDIICMHLERLEDYLMGQIQVGLRQAHRKEMVVVLDMLKGILNFRMYAKMVNVVILFEAAPNNRRRNNLLEFTLCKERLSGLFLLR